MRYRFRFRLRLLLLLVAAAAAVLWGFRAWLDHLAVLAAVRSASPGWQDLSFPDVTENGENVSPKPGFLHVRAIADCKAGPHLPAPWDLPEFSYFWVLRVWEPTPTDDEPMKMRLVSEHEYRDRLFTVRYDTHVKPEFSQELPLPPGRYFVQVSIPEMIKNPDGSLHSSTAGGSLVGSLSSFRVEVK